MPLLALPPELVLHVLIFLPARRLAVAARASVVFARALPAVVEAAMERCSSAWPTLLPGENATWALRAVEMLGDAGRAWRYLYTSDVELLLHHRESRVTLRLLHDDRYADRLSQDRLPQVTWSTPADVMTGVLLTGKIDTSFLATELSSFHPPYECIFAARRARDVESEAHVRAAAGSPLELLVRRAACGGVADISWRVCPCGALVWTTGPRRDSRGPSAPHAGLLRDMQVLAEEISSRDSGGPSRLAQRAVRNALGLRGAPEQRVHGSLSADGFRVTPGGKLVHEFPPVEENVIAFLVEMMTDMMHPNQHGQLHPVVPPFAVSPV
mmetsp:Transcript_21123/g.69734  ORF Transcript_21123/g.69734 Transcript_21123/m.69734 type:complete len:326 (-) Transcript_21123:107-1084(-)